MVSGVHPGPTDPPPDRDGPTDPAEALLAATVRHAPGWLKRVTVNAAEAGGVTIDPDDTTLATMVEEACEQLISSLEILLSTDVDAQRTNPLSLFRTSVTGANQYLAGLGARPAAGDRFGTDHFPDDVFELGPATWADIHPDLHEPGIAWGAWKAMTVLRRRRSER